MKRDNCAGCAHYLGGGACRINVEPECREGGGFELWEASEAEHKRAKKRAKGMRLYKAALTALGTLCAFLVCEHYGWKAFGLSFLLGCCIGAHAIIIYKEDEQ